MAVTLQYALTGHTYYRATYKFMSKAFSTTKIGMPEAKRRAKKQFDHWVENDSKIAEFKKSLELEL